MTENKRFEFREVNCTGIVPKAYDTEKQQYANLFECVEWLNDLHKENGELKKILRFLRNDNATDILNVLNSQENQIWELKKENEKLKENCKNYNWYKHYKTLLNENEVLKKENLDLSEELDYYKTKCASLETGLFQADKENGQLKQTNQRLNDELQVYG